MTWPTPDGMAAGVAALGSAWIQIVLNLCLLALETQPSCRTLSLQVVNGAGVTILVQASGAPERPSSIRADLAAAIAGGPAPLTARTVHGSLTGRLIRAAGGTIEIAAAGSGVTVTVHFRTTGSAAT